MEFHSDKLKRDIIKAQGYLDKLNQVGYLSQVGYIHRVKVDTEIYYQHSAGATNYHSEKTFDEKLAEVIKEKFDVLAALTLEKMEAEYKAQFVKEKNYLLHKLAEIETIEKEMA